MLELANQHVSWCVCVFATLLEFVTQHVSCACVCVCQHKRGVASTRGVWPTQEGCGQQLLSHANLPTLLLYISFDSCEMMKRKWVRPKLVTTVVVT